MRAKFAHTFRARFRLRLREVSGNNLKLWSDDTESELVLRVAPSMEFAYGDAREAKGPDEFDGILLVFFRLGAEGEEAQFIRFAEIIEES